MVAEETADYWRQLYEAEHKKRLEVEHELAVVNEQLGRSRLPEMSAQSEETESWR